MTDFDKPDQPHDADRGAAEHGTPVDPSADASVGDHSPGREVGDDYGDALFDDPEFGQSGLGQTPSGQGRLDQTPFGEAPFGEDLVRRESWPVRGVAELELAVDVGRIEVHLDQADDTAVRVEVRHDPSSGGVWAKGLSGVISWIGQATGGPGVEPADLAAEAVRAAEIRWSEPGRRLVVRSSSEIPARVVPLVVTVTAPAGSRLAARTGAGDVVVTGRAGWAAVRTGSGEVDVAGVDGDADVSTGSGNLVLGEVTGRARLRTGSGAVRLVSAGGPTDIKASSGDVTLGRVAGNLGVRTGSGEVRVDDARAGQLDLTTGSGELRVAVHPGVRAELDLTTGSGWARSELPVVTTPPTGDVTLRVRGRTGNGDVLVTRATVPA